MKLVQSCEQRYFYHKVAKVPHDADYEDSDALGIGKAFHGYLEDNGHGQFHTPAKFSAEIQAKCEEFNVPEEAPLVAAMALSYMKMHKASGLSVVVCEQKLESPIFVGFIDVILKDNFGGWWIGDLKTAARFDQSQKVATLPKDQQLNLYAHFAMLMAPHLGLDPELFLGCRYRVTTKTKSGIKEGETLAEFARRMVEKGSVESYDVIIPVQIMAIEQTWKRFELIQNRAAQITNGEAPVQNLESCFSYFKPCPYFSQCHGKCYSEATTTNEIKVMTKASFDEEKDML